MLTSRFPSLNQHPDKPVVLLYALECAALIIPWPSGIIYQNQTAGHGCHQSFGEGVLIPLESDLARKLNTYFTGEKWRGWCLGPIDIETADAVDAILANYPWHPTMRVARDQLDASEESWIHIEVANDTDDELLHGFGARRAILTWPNSD